jgi:hypothetical protein
MESASTEANPKAAYEAPPRAEPKAMPENMKDEESAKAMPRKPGSSSTILRCWEGQMMSLMKGQAARAASNTAVKAGRTRSAAKIAIKVSMDAFSRVSADRAEAARRTKRFPTSPDTPKSSNAIETRRGPAP